MEIFKSVKTEASKEFEKLLDSQFTKTQNLVIDSACHFEFLYHFINNVEESYPNLKEAELKKKTLLIIKILLKKKILNVNTYCNQRIWDLSVDESIDKIDKLWFEGASFLDFIDMIYFTRQKWFDEKLKVKGYNFIDNWVAYVNDNKWLKEILKINRDDLIERCE